MRAVFRPGFTIVDYLYDNPSSGGQNIITPGDTDYSYFDPATGRTYFYNPDGDDGAGWYYLGDEGLVNVGPNLDVSGMIQQ